MLWMKRNMPEAFDDAVMSDSILATGIKVGELARGYFGEFVNVPYSDDKGEMIARTKELIDGGSEVITEASFTAVDHFCSVDILLNHGNRVSIIEVKSSTDISDIYLDDMAFQYYVVTSCGYHVDAVYLMHINNQYERHGALDLKGLFMLNDCTNEIVPMQAYIEGNIRRMVAVADAEDEPECDIGIYCLKPYECGFRGYCWKHIPADSIFNVSRLFTTKKFELYEQGIISYEHIIKNEVKLNKNQMQQVKAVIENWPPQIDKTAIRQFLDTLTYPLYFLDFETFQQAIPEYDGVRPYMQIPFQYSLHILNRQGGELTHKEFLAEAGADPRRLLAEKLCNDIPKDVCVLAYNMGFEKGVIMRLSEMYLDLAAHLLAIHANIRDLMKPFADHAYYCKELAGSYSIKAVLPALCGDDPELDYHALDGVHNGSEAMNAFATLGELPPKDIAKVRRSLLAYCKLDTLAMVKILEKLYNFR
jgi:hypothetical protein